MKIEGPLTIELSDSKVFGPCDCCGQMTSRVWGYVYDGEVAAAAYFVEWTPGHEGSSATFDLIIGKWGDDSNDSERHAVSLDFRRLDSGPAFRVINASDRTVGQSSLVAKALDREEVIGKPIADRIFAMCDQVYLDDPRLSELRA